MLSILARSFMTATQSVDRNQQEKQHRQNWLPDAHWWKQKSDAREKVSLDHTFFRL
ncbi:hypothetical protein [Ruegeria lacuscaerulensis]|uniref:hypothetical protein n=1 Tax=Ruegeria lacuscaerulensis TaxID=55218 RepID=UPI001480FD8D|nr:hypothetical protein [Ruegeria lacuscaerulensis]